MVVKAQANNNTDQAAQAKKIQVFHQTLINAGATENEAKQFMDAFALCDTQSKEVEKDTLMSSDVKEQKLSTLNEEKNKKIKQYLALNDIGNITG